MHTWFDTQLDQKILHGIYCKANVRKLEETRMLLSLYFWLCYTKKDADNSKLVFEEVYQLIDSYHTKNRYFSTLLETERYQDIIEGEWFYLNICNQSQRCLNTI